MTKVVALQHQSPGEGHLCEERFVGAWPSDGQPPEIRLLFPRRSRWIRISLRDSGDGGATWPMFRTRRSCPRTRAGGCRTLDRHYCSAHLPVQPARGLGRFIRRSVSSAAVVSSVSPQRGMVLMDSQEIDMKSPQCTSAAIAVVLLPACRWLSQASKPRSRWFSRMCLRLLARRVMRWVRWMVIPEKAAIPLVGTREPRQLRQHRGGVPYDKRQLPQHWKRIRWHDHGSSNLSFTVPASAVAANDTSTACSGAPAKWRTRAMG